MDENTRILGAIEARAARVSGGGLAKDQDDRDDKTLLIRAIRQDDSSESGFIYSGSPEAFPTLPRCMCGQPGQPPCEALADGDEGGVMVVFAGCSPGG